MKKLHILQVVEASSGGVGRHVIDLSLGLLRSGHQTDIVYSQARSDPLFHRGLEQVRDIGGRTIHFEIASGLSFHDYVPILQIRKLLKQNHYDIIHLQSSKAGLVGRIAAMRLPMTKIYTPHLLRTASPGLGFVGRLIFGQSERLLAQITDRILCVSNFELNHALKLGIPIEKLIYSPNGYLPPPMRSRDEVRLELGLVADDLVFGFIGRLAPQKDPLTLISAFAQVRLDQPCKLVIVGGGELMDQCVSLVSRLGIQEKVRFLGHVDSTKYIAAFDVFVMSSLSESFPYVLLEAAAAHLPLISTSVGDIPELIQDRENGLLSSCGNVDELAQHMTELGSNPELRKMLRQKISHLTTEYTVDSMVQKTLDIYLSLLLKQ